MPSERTLPRRVGVARNGHAGHGPEERIMPIEIDVPTSKRVCFIDVTRRVERALRSASIEDGVVCVYVPHTTAAITINENADPAVSEDIQAMLTALVPFDGGYRHAEGNSAAHIKASIIGPSELVIVEGGELVLGTWQGIFFCEFDGPRRRTIWVKALGWPKAGSPRERPRRED
jgi:secondary thiamine-phosphate synthase enzyme